MTALLLVIGIIALIIVVEHSPLIGGYRIKERPTTPKPTQSPPKQGV